MKNRSFQRARQPAQKEQRRADILRATGELLDGGGLAAVTLSDIARRAGVAKSNVYRYFESREAILLELLVEDWVDYVVQIERDLMPLAGSGDAISVARVMADSAVVRPRLCELVSALASVLEQNVSEDVVLAFKRQAVALGVRMVNAVHAAMPALAVDRCWRFVGATQVQLAGQWPMSNPPPVVQAVLARPEFEGLHQPFGETLASTLRALLLGLQDPDA